MSKGVHSRAILMLAANQRKGMTGPPKREEIFKRMKVDSFVTLVLQSEQVQLEESLVMRALTENNPSTITDSVRITPASSDRKEKPSHRQQRSSLMSVISGLGESDFSRSDEAEPSTSQDPPPSRPYLLLDVRDEDEFAAGHVIPASNYPSSLLSRATHFETTELMAFKNSPGKLIIVYDSCEKEAPKVASTLVQRGYDNIALLTGGISLIMKKYPNGLYTGRVPPEILSPLDSKTKNISKKSAMKRISSVPNFKKPLKTELTAEDLEFLREQLQFNLLPKGSRSRLVRDTFAQKMRNEDSVRLRKQARNSAFRQHSYSFVG